MNTSFPRPLPVRTVAFDADDTLWENESYYREAERRFRRLVAPYAPQMDDEALQAALFRVESANMPLLGYGVKAFTLSMMESALALSGGRLTASDMAEILAIGRSVMHIPATPFPGVVSTLEKLRAKGAYRLILITKGELLGQTNKLKRSGLEPFFERVEVLADKTPEAYARILRDLDTAPQDFVMVGNSLKSDIRPALDLGGWGLHLTGREVWQYDAIAPFVHPCLASVDSFAQILDYL